MQKLVQMLQQTLEQGARFVQSQLKVTEMITLTPISWF